MGEPVDVIRLLAHAATANISAVIRNFANGWFGGEDAIGEPIEVEYVIESIKDVVMNGATVETKTSSGTWTKPSGIVELTVILISAGHNGENGNVGSGLRLGGIGGNGGSYRVQVLDPTLLPDTVTYTVGANGAPSVFGDISVVSGQPAARGDMYSFTDASLSLPGAKGGDGGNGDTSSDAATTSGAPGLASLLGTAGAGGSRKLNGGTAGNGTAGGNVSLTAATKCGGGGGGGGGGAQTSTISDAVAGAGGPGGYPGGPGGGGGGCSVGAFRSGTAGAGGLGAHGVIWIIHKSPTLPEEP